MSNKIVEITGYSSSGKTEICKLFRKNRRWKIFEIGRYYDEHYRMYRDKAWIDFALAISRYDGNCIVEHCGLYPKREILDLAFKDKEVYGVHLTCNIEDTLKRIKSKRWYKRDLKYNTEREVIKVSRRLRNKCNKENKSRVIYDSSKLSPKNIYTKICNDLNLNKQGSKKEKKYFFNIVEYCVQSETFAG